MLSSQTPASVGGPGDSKQPMKVIRTHRLATVLCALAVVAIAVRHLTEGVEADTQLLSRFLPPSVRHPLGTDQFGRDVLRLVFAGVFGSFGLAIATVAISSVLGSALALLSTASRAAGSFLTAVSDILLAIPTLIVALIVASTMGAGATGVFITLGALGWTPYFKLVRAHTIAASTEMYVEAAVASGASRGRVLVRHILPNITASLVALSAARFGQAIVSVSALSFLGVGPKPPSSEWGASLAGAQPHIERAPWAVAAPSTAIFLTTALAFWVSRRVTQRLA